MRSFEFAIGLRVFLCGASKFYAQNFCNFLYFCGGERGPFVRDDGCCRYERFVMISIITFATFVAVASISGYANKYLEKTSIAVITVWYPPLAGKLGSKSICMASSGPRSHSGRLRSSGVIALFGTRLSLAHISHHSTHFLTCFAIPG